MRKEKSITLTSLQKKLRRRIVELSYQRKLSHLGSCLSCVDIISAVYRKKKKQDIFVLSNGHAGYALYVVLEEKKLIKLDKLPKICLHPDREDSTAIAVSTGSLGQGLPIALGMALAKPKSSVYCLISDGECAEGSIWESLRLLCDNSVPNLMVIVNANGWAAYDKVNRSTLKKRLKSFGLSFAECNGYKLSELEKWIMLFQKKTQPQILFCQTTVEHFSFLKGLEAHYHVMTEQEYKEAIAEIKHS